MADGNVILTRQSILLCIPKHVDLPSLEHLSGSFFVPAQMLAIFTSSIQQLMLTCVILQGFWKLCAKWLGPSPRSTRKAAGMTPCARSALGRRMWRKSFSATSAALSRSTPNSALSKGSRSCSGSLKPTRYMTSRCGHLLAETAQLLQICTEPEIQSSDP